MRPIRGPHVFGMFALGFSTIIAVNLTLAFNAVQTFPGLEVKNSYVASQGFEANRTAQKALDWEVSAVVLGGDLTLSFEKDGTAIMPTLEKAVFGRATSVAEDQIPAFKYQQGAFVAPVLAGPGNWNLRVIAKADDGTRFQQRIIVEVLQ